MTIISPRRYRDQSGAASYFASSWCTQVYIKLANESPDTLRREARREEFGVSGLRRNIGTAISFGRLQAPNRLILTSDVLSQVNELHPQYCSYRQSVVPMLAALR